jgi:hypothetical protein
VSHNVDVIAFEQNGEDFASACMSLSIDDLVVASVSQSEVDFRTGLCVVNSEVVWISLGIFF